MTCPDCNGWSRMEEKRCRECQMIHRRIEHKAYHGTDEYKARRKVYRKAYRKTEKYKAYQEAFMKAYRKKKRKEAKA